MEAGTVGDGVGGGVAVSVGGTGVGGAVDVGGTGVVVGATTVGVGSTGVGDAAAVGLGAASGVAWSRRRRDSGLSRSPLQAWSPSAQAAVAAGVTPLGGAGIQTRCPM